MSFRAGGGPQRIFRLAGSASRNGLKDVTLTLVHTHATEPAEVRILLKGGAAEQVRHSVLSSEQGNAHNTFERPDTVRPMTSLTTLRGP